MLPDLSFDPRHLAAAARLMGVAVSSDASGRLSFRPTPSSPTPPSSADLRGLLKDTRGIRTVTLNAYERVVVDLRDVGARDAASVGDNFVYVEMEGEMLGQEPPLAFRMRALIDVLRRHPPGVEAFDRPFTKTWDVIGEDAVEVDLPEDLSEALLLLSWSIAREWAGFFQGA